MISDYLRGPLSEKNVSNEEFSELLIRLLDYGVLCRDENNIEQRLYDRYLRIEPMVVDFISVLGMRIEHNARFGFIRVYPPGAQVPSLPDDEHAPFNSGFRQRLNQFEAALAIILRVEYGKQLREGKVDEQGAVLANMEAISIAFHNLLKKSLPENITERRNLFRKLRQLRVLHYQSEEDLDSLEGWVKIRPLIMGFVGDAALDALEARTNEELVQETVFDN
ncbi:MAG TPA: DUF4194 domain-containing protein [Marinagarivorans sp.]